jgi:MoaA/NifB/PqqE/SkfB family radical SAM enzyme/cytosine/adenosine deaminase-related metal-dependent hydrolase
MKLLLKHLQHMTSHGITVSDFRIHDGVIVEIGEGLREHDEIVIRWEGYFLYPGLVNAHDHLEMNLYNRSANPPYRYFTEWAKEIYQPNAPPVSFVEKISMRDRLLWGGIKNLISGVTTVFHHNPYYRYFDASFPVSVFKNYDWAHSIAFGDKELKRQKRNKDHWFFIHAAEGTDERASAEFDTLKQLGYVDSKTVLIHGVGLTEEQIDQIGKIRCALVWCPSSNSYLFGQTAPISKIENRDKVLLGTDSLLTGSVTLLDEMRAAQATGLASAKDILEMVTTNPKQLFSIAVPFRTGSRLDGFIVPMKKNDYAENLLDCSAHDMEVVFVRGLMKWAARRTCRTLKILPNIHLSQKEFWIGVDVDTLMKNIRKKVPQEHLRQNPLWAMVNPIVSKHSNWVTRSKNAIDHLRQVHTHEMTRLPIAILMPHAHCNCRCVMCDIWKSDPVKTRLDEKELDNILGGLKRLKTRQVVMSGGEALLNPRIFEFCKKIKKEGMKISILSTGILLSRFADEIVAYTDDVIVSLDGPEEIHNQIRQVPNVYQKLREGVKAVKSLDPGFRVTARCVVQKKNFRFLPQVIDSAREIGFDQISFLAADISSSAFNREAMWASDKQNEIRLNKEEVDEFGERISKLMADYRSDFKNKFIAESPDKMLRLYDYYQACDGQKPFQSPECNAPWVSAVIETNGDVRPCFFHPAYGNLNGYAVDDMLNESKAVQFRKNLSIRDNPVCRKCVCSLNLSSWTRPD